MNALTATTPVDISGTSDAIRPDDLDRAKLSAARLWAANKCPYFASGLFAMAPVAVHELGTMAVDPGWRVYIDPKVLDIWSVPEVGSVLIHELCHLLRDHASRDRGGGGAVGSTRLEHRMRC